ncbi:unnamed protein product [Acanthoscelides obtectus]|uniref:Uncharacterized protein n=1 Tax=Acanthoscelides obtectus TaxID=200917 RepID=A0A9P0LFC4_ACAOB|nr:unnamed protein product [Acanthoscelides obtectus]CAK1679935.1 hypothetical protein AOBTE_LOCUS32462 [Acanthoscelides obtectus]
MPEIDLNYLDTSQKFDLDLSKIRIDHLNSEEKSGIVQLCRDHKERTKLLYSKINSDLIQNKEKTLERVNRDCDSSQES